MIEPEVMVAWLQRRIHSSETWLDDFSTGKRKRPDTEIESKRFDVQALQEILAAYLKAVKRKNEMENRNEWR